MTIKSTVFPLPPEVLHHVFTFLDSHDLCSASLVCRYFQEVANPLITQTITNIHRRLKPFTDGLSEEDRLQFTITPDVVASQTSLRLVVDSIYNKSLGRHLHDMDYIRFSSKDLLRAALSRGSDAAVCNEIFEGIRGYRVTLHVLGVLDRVAHQNVDSVEKVGQLLKVSRKYTEGNFSDVERTQRVNTIREEAKILATAFVDPFQRSQACLSVSEEYRRLNNITEGRSFLEEAVVSMRNIENPIHKYQQLVCASREYSGFRSQDMERAKAVLQEAKVAAKAIANSSDLAKALLHIGKEYKNLNLPLLAYSCLEDAIVVARASEDSILYELSQECKDLIPLVAIDEPDRLQLELFVKRVELEGRVIQSHGFGSGYVIQEYLKISQEYKKLGDEELSDALFAEVVNTLNRRTHGQLSPFLHSPRNELLKHFIQYFKNINEMSLAKQCLEMLLEDSTLSGDDSIFGDLVIGLQSCSIEDSLDWARREQNPCRKAKILRSLVVRQKRFLDKRDRIDLLQKITEIGMTLESWFYKSCLLYRLSEETEQLGFSFSAKGLLKEALECVQDDPNEVSFRLAESILNEDLFEDAAKIKQEYDVFKRSQTSAPTAEISAVENTWWGFLGKMLRIIALER